MYHYGPVTDDEAQALASVSRHYARHDALCGIAPQTPYAAQCPCRAPMAADLAQARRIVSPFVRRALAAELPVKEYGR